MNDLPEQIAIGEPYRAMRHRDYGKGDRYLIENVKRNELMPVGKRHDGTLSKKNAENYLYGKLLHHYRSTHVNEKDDKGYLVYRTKTGDVVDQWHEGDDYKRSSGRFYSRYAKGKALERHKNETQQERIERKLRAKRS